MKRYSNMIYALAMAFGGLTALTGCSDDAWGNDNPEYQNVFIVAFADWGPKSNNDKTYAVSQGQTLEVPVQLWCEGSRQFDAEAYVYVDSKLTPGTDFLIVDENGSPIGQNVRGGYTLTWDLRSADTTDNHRLQCVRVKALAGGQTGDVTLMTFDPKDVDENGKLRISNGGTKPTDSDYYVPNNQTGQYEVRCLTVNYKVKVTIE